MLFDYSMTVLGFRLYKKGFAQYYSMEHYEINPIFRDAIEQMDAPLYNKKHLVGVVLITVILFFLWFLALFPNIISIIPSFTVLVFEFTLGLILFMFLSLDLHHVHNYFLFRFVSYVDNLLHIQK